jgi:hypothetical protein
VEYDVAFRAGAREDAFAWEGEPGVATETAIGAVAVLGRLWCPTRVELELGNGGPADVLACKTAGDPDPLATAAAVAAALREAAAAHPGRRLLMLGPALAGWARVALPADAEPPGEWVVVSDEAVSPVPVQWREGPPEAGLATVWLDLGPAIAASDIEVRADAPGRLTARLRLGAVYFTPGLELRDADEEVRGAPVAAWQEANAILLSTVATALGDLGWRRA